MKKLLVVALAFASLTGCLKEPESKKPTVTYRYMIVYTNGISQQAKTQTCTTGRSYYCDPSPPFLRIDNMMCDLNGSLYISTSPSQYLKQEGFKCNNVITKKSND